MAGAMRKVVVALALLALAGPRGSEASTAASRAAKAKRAEQASMMTVAQQAMAACANPPCPVTPQMYAQAQGVAQGQLPGAVPGVTPGALTGAIPGVVPGFTPLTPGMGAPAATKMSAATGKEMDAMVMATSEQAAKIYLMAKKELTATDLTNFNAGHEKPVRGKHGVMKKPTTEPCALPDGCVKADKMRTFLHNKYIPGSDNVITPYLPDAGHMFKPGTREQALKDFRHYLLTRPLKAVPIAVRKLIFPGNDDQWPGGGPGADRTPYYPKTGVTAGTYWENDIEDMPQNFDGTSGVAKPAEPAEPAAAGAGAAVAIPGGAGSPIGNLVGGKHRRLLRF